MDMATQTVTVARIYLREGEHLLAELLSQLHDQEKVSGVTVLRGIAGFGPDGKMHMTSLVDLSLDLPLIVEFYDAPERVEAVLQHLKTHMGLSHVISWQAQIHLQSL
jgi:PII-like signaling protein